MYIWTRSRTKGSLPITDASRRRVCRDGQSGVPTLALAQTSLPCFPSLPADPDSYFSKLVSSVLMLWLLVPSYDAHYWNSKQTTIKQFILIQITGTSGFFISSFGEIQ